MTEVLNAHIKFVAQILLHCFLPDCWHISITLSLVAELSYNQVQLNLHISTSITSTNTADS